MSENWYAMVDQLQTLDEIYSVATEAKQQRSECDWILGELALRATLSEDGEKSATSLKHFAGSVNESYGKIKDAAKVVKKVDREMRAEFQMLEFGHWREIVRRHAASEDIRAWAEIAEEEGLTITKLRGRLTGETGTDYDKIMNEIVKRLGIVSSNLDFVTHECRGGFNGLREAIGIFNSVCEAAGGGRGSDKGEREHGGDQGVAG